MTSARDRVISETGDGCEIWQFSGGPPIPAGTDESWLIGTEDGVLPADSVADTRGYGCWLLTETTSPVR